jgi:hypothetical protein
VARNPSPARPARNRPRGGLVGHHQRQKNWYCTNRPQIEDRFKLPDWLKRKHLPKPGSEEFEKLREKLLGQLKKRGVDTSKLERFQKYLMKQAGRLETPEELPGFFESLGLYTPPPDEWDEERKRNWQKEMQNKTDAWFVRLLCSGDPELIAKGLKARAKVMGNYDAAMAEHAEAVITEIQANQKITEDGIAALPVVGDGFDLIAAATGETLSGTKLGPYERIFQGVCVLGPVGLEKYMDRRAARKALGTVASTAKKLDPAEKVRLARQLNIPPSKVDEAVESIEVALKKNTRQNLSRLDEAADNARIKYKVSPEGVAETRKWKKAAGQSQKKIDELAKYVDPKTGKVTDPAGFEKAMMDVQSDKLAQQMLIKAPGKHMDTARGAMKDTIENVVYKEVDDMAVSAMKKDPRVAEWARKHGLDPDKVEIKAMKITHTGKADPNALKKIGRDRDVTYQIVGKNADGKRVVVDVHHDVAEEAYGKAFYKRTVGDPPADASPGQLKKLYKDQLDKMDQTVTSKWHPEAYNTGEAKLADFLDHGKTPTITRPEDVADTFAYKSKGWFEKAAKATDPAERAKNVGEGMRQATKQWSGEVMPRVKKYGLDTVGDVPPKLQKAYDIMKRVDNMDITPMEAERMLKALPGGAANTPEAVVRQMGAFLEGLEKTSGKQFRALGNKRIVNALGNIPGPGTARHAQRSLETLNNALSQSRITGPVFKQQRTQVFSGLLNQAGKQGTPEAYRGVLGWLNTARSKGLISQQEHLLYTRLARQRGGL